MNTQEKLQTYLDSIGVQFTATRVPFRTDSKEWGEGTKHYACTLSRVGKDSIRGHYSQGSAIKTVPTGVDYVGVLAMDTQGIEGTSFDMWVLDFGYDIDSIKVLKIYQSCLQEYKELTGFFDRKELAKIYRLAQEL
jgi:hypothetical protein